MPEPPMTPSTALVMTLPLQHSQLALLMNGPARVTSPRLRGEVDAQRGLACAGLHCASGEGDFPKIAAPGESPSPRPSQPKSDISDFGRLTVTELGYSRVRLQAGRGGALRLWRTGAQARGYSVGGRGLSSS